MSHLVLRRIGGRWRMFNKHTKKVEGRAFEHKEEAAIETHKQDIKEDKQIDKGEEQEHKEHPEFSKKSAKKIAIDHIKEHPDMYKKGEGGGKMKKGRDWFKLSKTHSRAYIDKGMAKEIKEHAKSLREEEEEYGDAPSEEVYTGRHTEGHHGVGRGSDMGNMTYPKITSGYQLHDGPNVTSGGRMHKTASHGGKGEGKVLSAREYNRMEEEKWHKHVDEWKKRGSGVIPARSAYGFFTRSGDYKNRGYVHATEHGGHWYKTKAEASKGEGRGSGKIMNPYDKDYVLGRGGDRPPMKLDIKKGALHRQEHIPQGKKIPEKKLEALKEHGTPLERKRANFALVARSWKH